MKNLKIRRFSKLVLLILILAFFPNSIQAGTLNSNESSVLSVLQSGFEANGQSYKVAPEYIGQAREYFMQDDVDLTSEQRSEAIANIYGNVQQGVEEGYLIPSKGGSASSSDSLKADSKESNEGEADSKSKGKTEETLNGSTASEAETKTEKPAEKSTSSQVKVNKEKAKVQVVSSNGRVLLSAQTIIKNTGYSLNQTAALAGFFLLLYAACCRLILKYQLFKKTGESHHEE